MIFRRRTKGATDVDALVEEIERLELSSRERADEETLRRLLRLRHRAGIGLVGSNGSAPGFPPPSSAELPAAGDGRLPEHRPADLTPELLRAAILRDGCAVVRGLVEPQRAAVLAEEVRRVLETRARVEAGGSGSDALYEEFVPDPPYRLVERPIVAGAGGAWLADSPRVTSELFHLYEDAGLRRLVAGYLGERPTMSVNKSTLRSADASVSSIDWHQDGAFLGDVRSINVWLSLSHCGERAPGLAVVPRRVDRIVPTGTPGARFDWSVSPGVAEDEAGAGGTLNPVFAPGDAVLFDDHFLHATWVRPDMPETRYAVESWFFSPSTFPSGYVPLAF